MKKREVREVMYNKQQQYPWRCILLVMLLIGATNSSYANFGLNPYISGLGDSGAGGAAVSDDATTAFINPAGLVNLNKQQWLYPVLIYRPSIGFKNTGSKDALGVSNNTGNGGDTGTFTVAPSLYYAYPLSNKTGLGFSINSPFGLSSEYDDNWTGRYHSIKTSITTLTLTSSLGYQLNEQWSTGVGVNFQRTQAVLSNALDFGAICLSALDAGTCASLGLPAPQSADGKVVHDTDDWGAGFTFGLLWKNTNTHAGFSYRSKVTHSLSGNAKYTTPSSAFSPMFSNTDVTTKLTLPEVVSINIQHKISQNTSLLTGTTLTRWSRIDHITLDYKNPLQTDQTIQKKWKDVWRTALGFHYQVNPNWRIMSGLAYEQSNIPDENFEPGIPTSDATWLNIGAKFQWRSNVSLQLAWNHVFFESRSVNRVSVFGDTLNGEIDIEMDVLLAQLNWTL